MRRKSSTVPLFALSVGDIVVETVFDTRTRSNREYEFLIVDIERPSSRCDGDYVVKLVGCAGSEGHVSIRTWNLDFLSETQRVYAAPGRNIARTLEIARTLGDMATHLFAHREEIIEEGISDLKKWFDRKISLGSGSISADTHRPDDSEFGDR